MVIPFFLLLCFYESVKHCSFSLNPLWCFAVAVKRAYRSEVFKESANFFGYRCFFFVFCVCHFFILSKLIVYVDYIRPNYSEDIKAINRLLLNNM